MKKKLLLFVGIFFSSILTAEPINFAILNPAQLNLMCNVLYFSCQRMSGEIILQESVYSLYPACNVLRHRKQLGSRYKTVVPEIMKMLEHLSSFTEEHNKICEVHDAIIDRIINDSDKTMVTLLEAMAKELTELMQMRSNIHKDEIDTMLDQCKTELAHVAGTIHAISNTCSAIKDGNYPADVEPSYVTKVDSVQQLIEPMMQAMQRGFDTLDFIRHHVSPYNKAGVERLYDYYTDAYNCLTDVTNETQYFTQFGSPETALPKPLELKKLLI